MFLFLASPWWLAVAIAVVLPHLLAFWQWNTLQQGALGSLALAQFPQYWQSLHFLQWNQPLPLAWEWLGIGFGVLHFWLVPWTVKKVLSRLFLLISAFLISLTVVGGPLIWKELSREPKTRVTVQPKVPPKIQAEVPEWGVWWVEGNQQLGPVNQGERLTTKTGETVTVVNVLEDEELGKVVELRDSRGNPFSLFLKYPDYDLKKRANQANHFQLKQFEPVQTPVLQLPTAPKRHVVWEKVLQMDSLPLFVLVFLAAGVLFSLLGHLWERLR